MKKAFDFTEERSIIFVGSLDAKSIFINNRLEETIDSNANTLVENTEE